MVCKLTSKSEIGKLEEVAENVQIPSHEDEDNGASEDDRGGTGVLPL